MGDSAAAAAATTTGVLENGAGVVGMVGAVGVVVTGGAEAARAGEET